MHKQNNKLAIQRITQRQFQEETTYSVPLGSAQIKITNKKETK